MIVFLFLMLLSLNLNVISQDADIQKIVEKYCPDFFEAQKDCNSLAKKMEQQQKAFKDNPIFEYLEKIEESKNNYEKLQKQAQDCRAKATPLCKNEAEKAFGYLTDVNISISKVMNILTKWYSYIPKPIIEDSSIEGYKYKVVKNYDKSNFYKALNNYLDSSHFDSKVTPMLKDLKKNNDLFSKYYQQFQNCLDKLSKECDPQTKIAYQELTNMNNYIAKAMQILHDKFPTITEKSGKIITIEAPITKEITLTGGYNYTHVTNFNGDNFTKALTKMRETAISPGVVGGLEKCQDLLKECQGKIREFGEEQQKKMIPLVATNIGLSLGEFIAVEKGLAVFGVPGVTAMVAALIITSVIPGLDELTSKVSNWLVEGFFGMFSGGKINIPKEYIPREIEEKISILPEIDKETIEPEIGGGK